MEHNTAFQSGQSVFFIDGNELSSGVIKAVIVESGEGVEDKVSYRIESERYFQVIEEHCISDTVEGVFKKLFEAYKAKSKKKKGLTEKVDKLSWGHIFDLSHLASYPQLNG